MNPEFQNNQNNQYDPKNPSNNYNPFEDNKVDKEYEKKWRTWNNFKPQETPVNKFYGVDVNDKEAVKREFKRLKRQHALVTFITVIILGIMGLFAFELYRVNILEQHPILAIKKRVDNGYLYRGIGYESLYCDDGTKYVMNSAYASCNDNGVTKYDGVILKSFKEYAKENNMMDESKLLTLSIESYEFDETTTETYTDLNTGEKVTNEYNYYLVQFNYSCSNDSHLCINFGREFKDYTDAKVYVKMNKDNKVVSVEHFKASGIYYENLKADLIPKVREYFVNTNLIPDDEAIRTFGLTIKESYGYYKYNGTYYGDAYVVSIEYTCLDNGNTCVDFTNYDDTENLTFNIALFIDLEGNVSTIAKTIVFER